MDKEPVPLHNDKPFYVRAKQVDISNGELEREKRDSNHLLVKDTRGRIFRLADIEGEFLRSTEGKREFPVLLRVQGKQDGDYEVLNIVSDVAELKPKSESDAPQESSNSK